MRTTPDAALVERDKRIVALREQGWSFNEISMDVGISVGRVNTLYYRHCAMPGDGVVPDGMSMLTAREVNALMGVWPSPETAEFISARLMDIMQGSRRRKVILEVNDWLEGLGVRWSARERS